MIYRPKIRIGVIGGAQPSQISKQHAFRVGQLIAEKGAILVCGGLKGTMEAAAKGAKEKGGLTIGVLPGENPGDANPYIEIGIATGIGYSRNAVVVMNADVLIAIDGQYGTLSEIAYACIQKKKVIGLSTWDIEGVIPVTSPEEAVDEALKDFYPLLR
ncbi:MAG: TIGR00725 family protein [Candidatus Aminicenantes bacterium]|nr:TIGR00725 family protein [Candidatus Aminicenantes bacterium]